MTAALPLRPRLLEPRLPRREPGVEHYRVKGGGSIFLTLHAGDHVTITDVEGRQPCELAIFTPDGHTDFSAIKASGASNRPDDLPPLHVLREIAASGALLPPLA